MAESPVSRFFFVISAFLVLCLVLLCIDNSSLFGVKFQVTRLVNNFDISIIAPGASPSTPDVESKNVTEKEYINLGNIDKREERERPETKQPGRDERRVACSGRYIYVHDVPSKFNDDLIKDCRKLIKWFDMCPYMVNSGLGPRVTDDSKRVLPGSDSWFSSNQFLLEVIFRERMKSYGCLTNDSSVASAVYIPFYAGFDISRHLWGYNVSVRDKLGHELANWLMERPEWKRMYGRDHFFVSGRIGWDFRRESDDDSGWGNILMKLPQFMNTTMLNIETTAWGNEFAIPYPTYFHPSSKTEVLEWQNKVKNVKRSYLFSFAGAPRPNMTDSIRGEILKQCLASQGKCKLLDCSSSGNACDNPVKIMEVFQESVFCLQPQGDSSTRRSTFDSILAGCIPVFFFPGSAYTQYVWYFPKNYTKYSVYIPEEEVKNQTISIEKVLSRFNEREVLQMREEVVRLIPRIVYGKPGLRSEKLGDAFDIAVDRVLERVEKVRNDIAEGKDPQMDFTLLKDLRKIE